MEIIEYKRGIFWIFFPFYVLNSTLLHLPPLRILLCRRMLGSNPGLLRLRHSCKTDTSERKYSLHVECSDFYFFDQIKHNKASMDAS
jgi:hypothetical protein